MKEQGGALVVLVFDELDDDLLRGLNLQHLQDEAQEVAGLICTAVCATHVIKLNGAVHQRFRCERRPTTGSNERTCRNGGNTTFSRRIRRAFAKYNIFEEYRPVKPKQDSFQYVVLYTFIRMIFSTRFWGVGQTLVTVNWDNHA